MDLHDGNNEADPDQLFTKHTIAEVRAKQIQLRADAEAKQEELRIMVGERYRELLQSSTVIISIADSAKRVQDALDEISGAIHLQQDPPVHSRVSNINKEADSHLHTLQVLSAHIKLLLDAPEQLWRLIERERYFQAAWLFLLARVVHRALIRDDSEDAESWINQGVDVLEQFPLIQRQWETVSHFRTQIIHRATLSLRSVDKSHEDTCATLLTLHILESRPLTETLSVYLSQRTKTLNALLPKNTDQLIQNGQPADILKTSEKTTPPKPPAAVIHSVQVLLEAISQTLKAAREIFGVSSSTGPMALRVLENMQAESFHSSASGQSLPVNLLISSQSVLSALPSSTYFSLLPANIRSYKPFVDLSSASSSLCSEFLEEKLGGWFIQSTGRLRDALHRAFSSLQSVGGVWRVRSAVHKWTSQCGLNHGELSSLSSLVEEVAGKRIMDIWKSALALAESTFVEQLSLLIPDHMGEFPPMHTMYPALPVPAFPPPGSGLPSFDLSFRRFRSHLAGQLHGRTPRLQQVLAILEEAAASLQRDLTKISSNGKESRLFDELIKTYRPEAENLCSKIIHALTESVDQRIKDLNSEIGVRCLVFHAQLALELSTTSSFASNIGCGHDAEGEFRQHTNALFERIMDRWRDYTISSTIAKYTAELSGQSHIGSRTAGPSYLVLKCLHSLSSSLYDLGMVYHTLPFSHIAFETISGYSISFMQAADGGAHLDCIQLLYDLSFLRQVISTWETDTTALTSLNAAISRVRSQLDETAGEVPYDPDHCASETLARTQMLISALLPISQSQRSKDGSDKLAALLSYGVPAVDPAFVPVVELAQPSARFPLLLIDNR